MNKLQELYKYLIAREDKYQAELSLNDTHISETRRAYEQGLLEECYFIKRHVERMIEKEKEINAMADYQEEVPNDTVWVTVNRSEPVMGKKVNTEQSHYNYSRHGYTLVQISAYQSFYSNENVYSSELEAWKIYGYRVHQLLLEEHEKNAELIKCKEIAEQSYPDTPQLIRTHTKFNLGETIWFLDFLSSEPVEARIIGWGKPNDYVVDNGEFTLLLHEDKLFGLRKEALEAFWIKKGKS